MKMNKFAAEVHQNAVEHGWWDEERSFGEIIALCHSELSEALEEYRAKRGMVWYACTEGDQEHPCRPEDEYDCQKFGKEVECEYRSKKPEGIAVELADCIIRILDWFGKDGADTDDLLEDVRKHRSGYTGIHWWMLSSKTASFGEFVSALHGLLSNALYLGCETCGKRSANQRLALVVACIIKWAEDNGVDMEKILDIKHEYNKGRPYRHGGKAL